MLEAGGLQRCGVEHPCAIDLLEVGNDLRQRQVVKSAALAQLLTRELTPEERRANEVAAFKAQTRSQVGLLAIGGGLMLLAGLYAPAAFMSHFIVFVLAVFVGFQVIWNVSHSLHTPLMAVTNAISSDRKSVV